MRLIDADIIQDELATLILYVAGTPEGECVEYAHNLIDAQPTIDTNPTVHAHWNKDADGRRCSNCKCLYWDKSVPATAYSYAYYCPHCGAKMDGE